MSVALVRSRALIAMTAPPVQVEVHLANGLPAFHIVGLPQAEVRESRERVRAALSQPGFEFPNRRITVNLAPADLPKESGRFDLPVALGVLAASGQLPCDGLDRFEAVGELSLNGQVRPIRGAIAMALAIARSGESRTLMLPAANVPEASLIQGVRLTGVENLQGLRALFARPGRGGRIQPIPAATGSSPPPAPTAASFPDFRQVVGHAMARRALEIAAAGQHSILMSGAPGAGKSMLAERLPGILPPMTEQECAEVAAIASLRGAFPPEQWGRRPFRSPHHVTSAAALIGGGSIPRPGEISLAHQGVLFLDELPEFPRPVLEALREPLETGRIHVSRALRQAEFPARFQLVAAMNPCPCGYLGTADGRCRCTPEQVMRYRARLSGPLLDRIDLRLDVPVIAAAELLRSSQESECSAAIRARVTAARLRQLRRQSMPNAQLTDEAMALHCAPTSAARDLLSQASLRFGLSSRAVTRVLKLARTITDLQAGDSEAGSSETGELETSPIDVRPVAEALQLRLAHESSPAQMERQGIMDGGLPRLAASAPVQRSSAHRRTTG